MDFSKVKEITIPEGSVKELSIGGQVVWKKKASGIRGYYKLNPTAIPDNRLTDYIVLGSNAKIAVTYFEIWPEGEFQPYNSAIGNSCKFYSPEWGAKVCFNTSTSGKLSTNPLHQALTIECDDTDIDAAALPYLEKFLDDNTTKIDEKPIAIRFDNSSGNFGVYNSVTRTGKQGSRTYTSGNVLAFAGDTVNIAWKGSTSMPSQIVIPDNPNYDKIYINGYYNSTGHDIRDGSIEYNKYEWNK